MHQTCVTCKKLVREFSFFKVFAHSFQEGTNLCGNITTNNCSHLCFGGPGNTYSCLCPQDMELVDGNCSCLGNKPPEDSGACPPIEITCPMNYFTCSNKKCIPDSWRCNKHDDCQDGSDEVISKVIAYN